MRKIIVLLLLLFLTPLITQATGETYGDTPLSTRSYISTTDSLYALKAYIPTVLITDLTTEDFIATGDVLVCNSATLDSFVVNGWARFLHTLQADSIFVLGDGADIGSVNTSDWKINATGDMTGIGGITSNGLIQTTLGLTVTGAVVNLNASSNFAINIATGTSTGAVIIGDSTGAQSILLSSGTGDLGLQSTDDINMGTYASACNIAIGNQTGATSVVIDGGSGDVSIQSMDDLNICTSAVANDIVVGNNTGGTTLALTSATWNIDANGEFNTSNNVNFNNNFGVTWRHDSTMIDNNGSASQMRFKVGGSQIAWTLLPDTSKVNYNLFVDDNATFAGSINQHGTGTSFVNLTADTVDGGSNNAIINIGSIGTAQSRDIDSSYIPVQVNVASTTNPATPISLIGGYYKASATTVDQPNTQIVGLASRCTLTKDVSDAYGLQSHVTIAANSDAAGGNITAISGKTILQWAPTGSIPSAGLFTIEGAFHPTTAYGVWIDNTLGARLTAGLEINASDSAYYENAISIDKGASATVLTDIKFSNGATAKNMVDTLKFTEGYICLDGTIYAHGHTIDSVWNMTFSTSGANIGSAGDSLVFSGITKIQTIADIKATTFIGALTGNASTATSFNGFEQILGKPSAGKAVDTVLSASYLTTSSVTITPHFTATSALIPSFWAGGIKVTCNVADVDSFVARGATYHIGF